MRTLIISAIYVIPIVLVVHWGWDALARDGRDISARLMAGLHLAVALLLSALFALQILPLADAAALVRFAVVPLRAAMALLALRLYLNLLRWPKKLSHRRLSYLLLIPIFLVIVMPVDAMTMPAQRIGFWVHPSFSGSRIALAVGALFTMILTIALARARRSSRHPNARGRLTGLIWATSVLTVSNLVLGVWASNAHLDWLPPYAYIFGAFAWVVLLRMTVVRHALVPSNFQRYRTWFEQHSAALILTSSNGRVLDMNAAAVALLGSPDSLPAIFPPTTAESDWACYADALNAGQAVDNWEQTILDRDHNPRLATVDGEVLDVGVGRYWSFGLRDITQQREEQERAERLAFSDPLTGAYNAVGLRSELDTAVRQRPLEPAAVIFIDLDNFKAVNDTFGHRIGDMVLAETTARLAPLFRPQDVVARLGGDEFVVLLRNTRDLSVEEVLIRITRELDVPFVFPDLEPLSIQASIGLSRFPDDSMDAEVLLHQADKAMYEAKRAGKHQYRVYRGSDVQLR